MKRRLKLFSIQLPLLQKLSDSEKARSFFTILSNLRIPFSLELAVHNVGRHINFYIGLPKVSEPFVEKAIKKIWPDIRLSELHDYNLFGTDPVVVGAYLSIKGNKKIDPEKATHEFLTFLKRFSTIEVIGEGIAFQIVCWPLRKKDHFKTNIRFLLSAGAEFRSRELYDDIIKSIPDFKVTKMKRPQFITEFINQEFNQKHTQELTVDQLTQLFHI